MMLKGAMGKRFNYFLSSMIRFVSFVGLLIAYIVVKVTVNPSITWLNVLLLYLCLGCLISGLFNLVLCGMPATGYKQGLALQIICTIVTFVSGGIGSSILTLCACVIKVQPDEIENEKIVKIKKVNKYGKEKK